MFVKEASIPALGLHEGGSKVEDSTIPIKWISSICSTLLNGSSQQDIGALTQI